LTKPQTQRDRGTEIAILLWPGITLEPPGGFLDHYGIDGHLNGETVQIKYDSRISQSGNIYHEFYEKSANHPEQPWRKSPGIAAIYIFTTETATEIIGYLVKVDVLARAELGSKLIAINPNSGAQTSIGILLPLVSLKKTERRQPRR